MMENNLQNVDLRRYHIIPRTLIFLFNQQSQVLLIKGSESKQLWSGLYNGIGGHIERGEDIIESAERELLEETGLSDIDLLFCGQVMIDTLKDTGIALFIFKGLYNENRISGSQEGDLYWVGMEELKVIPLVEDLLILLPKVHQFKLGDPLIIGKYIYPQDGGIEILIH